jgi:hypothetical protein
LKKVVERHGDNWKYLPADVFGDIVHEFDDLRQQPRRLN